MSIFDSILMTLDMVARGLMPRDEARRSFEQQRDAARDNARGWADKERRLAEALRQLEQDDRSAR